MFRQKIKAYKTLAVGISVIFVSATVFLTASAFKDPASAPGDTMYTLEQIYCKLTNCTATTYGLDSPGTPIAYPNTMHTIEQVYTATPDFRTSGGDAVAGAIFSGKTAYSDSSALLTGTLDLACNDPTFDGSDNLVDNDHDAGGDGTNRWLMTDSGDAIESEVRSGKVFWVDGVELTGTKKCITDDGAAATTRWGAGLYGCEAGSGDAEKRCYNGECYTCNGKMLPYTCTGGLCAITDAMANTSGEVCWREGTWGISATAICASYGGCVADNWNDTATCEVCRAWRPTYGCASQSETNCPAFYTTTSFTCERRATVVQGCNATGWGRYAVCYY